MRKLVLIMFAFASIGMYAQKPDSLLNKEVKVSTDYNPVITESQRVFYNPSAVNGAASSKKKVDYDLSGDGVQEKMNLGTPAAALMAAPSENLGNKNYVNLGVGSYGNFLGDAYFSLYSSSEDQLSLRIKHHSIWGDAKLDNGAKSTIGLNNSYGKLAYEKISNDLVFSAGVSYLYHAFRYYGLNNDGTAPANNLIGLQTNWKLDLGLQSTPSSTTVLAHDTKLSLSQFTLRDNLSQMNFVLGGNYSYNLGDDQKVGVDAEFLSNSYTILDKRVYSTFYNIDNRFSFHLNPYYLLTNASWMLKIGAGVYACMGASTQFLVTPNLEGVWNLGSDNISLYAKLEGKLKTNDFQSIIQENSYVQPWLNVTPTKVPLDGTLGVKGSVSTKMNLDLWTRYTVMNNQYLFTNQLPYSSNQFNVVYDDIRRTSVGGSLSYTEKNLFDINLTCIYNNYTTDKQVRAWYMPELVSTIVGNYYYDAFWKFSASYNLNAGRYSRVNVLGAPQQLKSWNDFSLAAEYTFTSQVKLYAQLNDLFNSHYYEWDGYNGMGINVLVGARFTF